MEAEGSFYPLNGLELPRGRPNSLIDEYSFATQWHAIDGSDLHPRSLPVHRNVSGDQNVENDLDSLLLPYGLNERRPQLGPLLPHEEVIGVLTICHDRRFCKDRGG